MLTRSTQSCKVVLQCNKTCSYTLTGKLQSLVWHEPIRLRLQTNSPQRTMMSLPAQSRLCHDRLESVTSKGHLCMFQDGDEETEALGGAKQLKAAT